MNRNGNGQSRPNKPNEINSQITVPKLLSMGLTVEQVAQALLLSEEIVQAYVE